MEQPDTKDTIAYWANLVIANIWIATGDAMWAIPFLLMALVIRWPYWWRMRWRSRGA
jgi:hypothetical protein